jgi:hypothetical protein
MLCLGSVRLIFADRRSLRVTNRHAWATAIFIDAHVVRGHWGRCACLGAIKDHLCIPCTRDLAWMLGRWG